MRRAAILVGAAVVATFWSVPAHAALVTSLPGGTVVAIPDHGFAGAFGAGPETLGSGITWTSTTADSLFGYDGTFGYGFGPNGFWDGTLAPMIMLNAETGTMTFAFASPVSGVGGFLNYDPDHPSISSIAVYDSNFNLLESSVLTFIKSPFDTNSGEFLGFERGAADISYFTLSNDFVGITDLTVEGAAVPEPGTLVLLGAGIAGLAARRRRAQ